MADIYSTGGFRYTVRLMEAILPFVIGVVFGAGVVLLLVRLFSKDRERLAQQLAEHSQQAKLEEMERLTDQLKDSFKALSHEALAQNTDQFFQVANEKLESQSKTGVKELDTKKQLIDQTLTTMRGELKKVQDHLQRSEKESTEHFTALNMRLRSFSDQTAQLQDTTAQLKSVLASTKARGQWGERMAEDVLRLAGFIEGVNYLKQATVEQSGARPDFTFLLPKDLKLNMDVKFPFNNYLNYLEADGEADKDRYKKEFLRDVRLRIKEVTTRDYINPEQKTVDYALVFIPNEQVYGFIHEQDTQILDDAMRNRVIFCSPLTLYAILAVIRQSISNFKLEQTGAEILSLFGAFYQQWEKFNGSLDKMGKRLEDAHKEFESLTTTRKRALERPLNQIERIREERDIDASDSLNVSDGGQL